VVFARRGVRVLVIALVILAPSVSSGQSGANRHVVIVTPAENDEPRLVATRDAIAFWNQTLSDLHLPTRLREVRVLVAPPITRRLEGYTRDIELDGDIVVFFSQQQIFSFAWPFAERTRFFMGVQTATAPPLTYPNVARNVIAHEFGHALGLEHNGPTSTLMCGPCEHLVYRSDRPVFFPLTLADHARLRRLHPR
jgi:hypothetical protein